MYLKDNLCEIHNVNNLNYTFRSCIDSTRHYQALLDVNEHLQMPTCSSLAIPECSNGICTSPEVSGST